MALGIVAFSWRWARSAPILRRRMMDHMVSVTMFTMIKTRLFNQRISRLCFNEICWEHGARETYSMGQYLLHDMIVTDHKMLIRSLPRCFALLCFASLLKARDVIVVCWPASRTCSCGPFCLLFLDLFLSAGWMCPKDGDVETLTSHIGA